MYQSPVFNVEIVEVTLANDHKHVYQFIDHPDSTTIVPLDTEGNIWFVEQVRIGSQSNLLELPAGVLKPGEKPLDCAKREIREEIGMGCKEIIELGSYYLAPGYCNECNYAFLAKSLYPAPLEKDEDEFLVIKKMSAEEAYQLATNAKLLDSKSLAALMLAKKYIFPAK